MSEIKVKNLNGNVLTGGGAKLLLSVILASAVSILLLLITAIILTVTNLSAEATGPVIGCITYFSVLLAGVIAGSGAKRRGWLRGAASGVLYLLTVRLLGWLTMGAVFWNALWGALLPGIFVGAVGGIIGINIFRKK